MRVIPKWFGICQLSWQDLKYCGNLPENVHLWLSNWNCWVLVYLTNNCFFYLQHQKDKRDPYKYNQVSPFHRILAKMDCAFIHNDSFTDLYIYIENCFCVNLDTDDDIEDMIDVSLYSIIISAPHYYIKSEEFETYLQFNEINYELQVNLHTWSNRHKIWDRDIYSRHVGQFIGWWYQSRKVNVWGHSQSIDLLKENVRYNLGYLEVTSSEVLKYMGGQIHIFCDIHRMPLIVSTDRKLKWNCGSKE